MATSNSIGVPYNNTINYAQKYMPELLEIVNQGALTSPFIVSNVNWMGAQTFNFTFMSTSGFKTHKNGSWNVGKITQGNRPFSIEHDRNILIPVDKNNVDVSNQTANIANVGSVFTRTQWTPEVDAYFFSKVATVAISKGLQIKHALASYTADNVYPRILDIINKPAIKRYRQKGAIILYVRTEIMDLLAISPDFKRNIEVTQIAEGGTGIETRITSVNGVTLIEVIDTDRFATAFDFTDGFTKAATGQEINLLVACLETCKTVPKIESIYWKSPGEDLSIGDSYGLAIRALWDTFVFPNGIDGEVDSVYVETNEA